MFDWEEANEEKVEVLKSDEFKPILDKDKFYCLDGGFAAQLGQHYKKPINNDPLWSCRALLTDPAAVQKTHEDFIRAGANIIITNTYQAHVDLFRTHIKDEDYDDDPKLAPYLLMEKAVMLADQAVMTAAKVPRGPNYLVAGSVGPYGACQCDGSEYTGQYIDKMSRSALKEWHTERLKRLTFGAKRVDLIAVETIPSYVEALAILDALDSPDFDGIQCWISFSCKDGKHTARGEPIREAFRQLVGHNAWWRKVVAIGVNCVNPGFVSSLLEEMNMENRWEAWPNILAYQKVPYVVYPNTGQEWDPVERRYVGDSHDLVDKVQEWMCLGANIIGGCCEVGPDDITKISDQIMLHAFSAREARRKAVEAADSRDSRDDFENKLKRLKKPSYDELKQREKAAQEAFKDLGDNAGAFSHMQAKMEALLREKQDE